MAKQLQRPDRIGQRLSTSDSLKTTDIWQKSIGYDPYAEQDQTTDQSMIQETGEINSSAKGLFQLARLTGSSTTVTPGSCKYCGQVGHLAKQCRNMIKLNPTTRLATEELNNDAEEDEDPDSDPEAQDEDEESGSGSDSDSDSSSSSSSSAKKKKKKKKKKDKKKKKKDKKKDKKKKKSKKRKRSG